jgi:dienelactone hydrolase
MGSLLDVKDARAQITPRLLLASGEEPVDLVAAYKTVMGDRVEITTYEAMHHGWMGARANLKDKANEEEFQRGYEQASVFCSKQL